MISSFARSGLPSLPASTPPRRAAPGGLRAALAWTVLACSPLGGAWGSGGPVTDDPAAAIRDEGRTLVVKSAEGSWSYTLDDWRDWAREHLTAQVPTPLAIGPRTVGVADFERFGAAALDPATGDVFVSVTTYAMLTTLSLVGVLDPAEPGRAAVALLPEPRMGDVEEPLWAPGARTVAYALGTARGRGVSLHLDDVAHRRALLALTAEEMHRAWLEHGLPLAPGHAPEDPRAYVPGFRDLAWDAAGDRLAFTVDPPGAGPDGAPSEVEPRRWSVRADGTGLRLEEAAAAP